MVGNFEEVALITNRNEIQKEIKHRPRMKWENNINHDLREVDYTGDDWKPLAQDRDVWRAYVRTAMNLRVP
ncbi:hypothetical protein C0J52_12071 [Blattella germanica]|nr:hypothetical protein C0J52_12071 [Blattella germanica]